MNYTVKEVREAATTNEHPIPLRVRDMLTAYADMIESVQGEAWSHRMATKEAGQYVCAGAHGIPNTPAPTAEPVAQGEVVKTAAMDFETWLREVDALYDKHLAKHDGRYIAASTHLRHEGWRAALEAIDLAAVRRAVDQLREACRTSNDSAHGTLSTSFVGTYLDDIEAAIKGES